MSFDDILASLASAVRLHQHRRQVYRELSAMDDRDLQDLGIARYDIPRIARTSHPRRDAIRPAGRHGVPSVNSAFPA